MSQKSMRMFVKLGALELQSKAGAQLQIGGVNREADITESGEVFYTESIIPSELRVTLIHTAETDLEFIKAFRDETIEARLDTGRVYTIPKGFYKSDGGLRAGEVECIFGGNPAIPN